MYVRIQLAQNMVHNLERSSRSTQALYLRNITSHRLAQRSRILIFFSANCIRQLYRTQNKLVQQFLLQFYKTEISINGFGKKNENWINVILCCREKKGVQQALFWLYLIASLMCILKYFFTACCPRHFEVFLFRKLQI